MAGHKPVKIVTTHCVDCNKPKTGVYRSPANKRERCYSCANKKRISDGKAPWPFLKDSEIDKPIEFLKNRSITSRAQVIAQGGVPNARKFTSENSGSKHYNWRGGLTSPNKAARSIKLYYDWRKAVYERDNYTCYICTERGGKLSAHHIKTFAAYPELRYEVSNGMTVCVRCHNEVVHRNFKWIKEPLSLDEINEIKQQNFNKKELNNTPYA